MYSSEDLEVGALKSMQIKVVFFNYSIVTLLVLQIEGHQVSNYVH